MSNLFVAEVTMYMIQWWGPKCPDQNSILQVAKVSIVTSMKLLIRDKLIFFDVKVYTRTWRISVKLCIKKVTQVQCSGCLISNWILSWLESWWHGEKPPKIRDQNFNIQASCGMVTDSTRYRIILQLEEHFSSAIHNQVDMSNFKLWNQQQNKLWMVFLQM